jgi:TrmH family RNA methyltransferase
MKLTVVLVRPRNPENIGLVARNMKNTGFEELSLVGVVRVDQKSYVTAVHARDILERARLYPGVREATADFDLIFASTSKRRKNFPSLSLKDAVEKMFQFPASAKVGLLFGNERTGLTSAELRSSNFRFMIPQAVQQPSYNLASAVLLTLFHIFSYGNFKGAETSREKPLSRIEQEEFIRFILLKLEEKNFIHSTNKRHMTDMIYDLFGRFTLTAKDRKLFLALFSKAAGR